MNQSVLEDAARRAEEYGFSHAVVLDASTITLYPDVRDMCNEKQCREGYGKNWMCPPACPSLEENTARLRRYTAGIIVQTTIVLKSDFDMKGMTEAASRHQELFRGFRKELLKEWPGLLALGAGGCHLCKECTYPDDPCRMPDEALSSMEAFGMMVNEVVTRNGMKYNHGQVDGKRTLTYSGCYLLEQEEAAATA